MPSRDFDPSLEITISDITFDTFMFSIHLKHSKSDREGKGSTDVIRKLTLLSVPYLL